MDAAVLTAVKVSVDHRRADSLLRMWWAESHGWALERPKGSPDDETLLHDTLHHLATHGLPDEASPPSLEMATRSPLSWAGVWAQRVRCMPR